MKNRCGKMKKKEQLMTAAIVLQNHVHGILKKIITEHYDNSEDDYMKIKTDFIHCHTWEDIHKETTIKFILSKEVCID